MQKSIKIIFTTDIHGNYFPYDFRQHTHGKGGLQSVHAYVADACMANPGGTILVDGGDILQGEPTAYYFNYLSRSPRHRVADFCNFIGYDVGVMGNHDIETGHAVYDRYVRDCYHPILAANAIDTQTGESYFEPYTIIRRMGVRIAFIGFITPAIPHWIPPTQWTGIKFEDIPASAAKWVRYVQEKEHPDYIVGIIHSGTEEGIVTPDYRENSTRETAAQVEGFDLILYGHDHSCNMEQVTTPSGRAVTCVNPGSGAVNVAEAELLFDIDDDGRVTHMSTSVRIVYVGNIRNTHSHEYRQHFKTDFRNVSAYSSKVLGTLACDLNSSDAFFGSSAYMDLIHEIQLHVSGADISFAAPLFFNAHLPAGQVRVGDMYKMYRFEDHLYVIKLTGEEVRTYLEYSLSAWVQQMHSADSTMLQIMPMKHHQERMGFRNFIFNFDSAAGIRYSVDVSKPAGSMLTIHGFEDGRHFCPDAVYRVAITAYRVNGGGELLTKGVGLDRDEIQSRVLSHTDNDIRYYLMEYIQSRGIVLPHRRYNWSFEPRQWTEIAERRERMLLFGTQS